MDRFWLVFKALRELGPTSLALYALYRLGIKTGYYRWRTSPPQSGSWVLELDWLPLPERGALTSVLGEALQSVIAQAEQVRGGDYPLFGGEARPLQLTLPGPLRHWTYHESPTFNGQDIKWVWEAGRFGWAFSLGRAYHLSGAERYPLAFFHLAHTFFAANPPYRGPNWASGQEVALRLLALVFAARVFPSPAEEREFLGSAIALHAARIVPTLVYARAQNNNHLLSEAVALYTAGLVLPGHPQASRWRKLGWRWLQRGLRSQIAPDGSYIQQSCSYHRLMLQLALWAHLLAAHSGQPFPEESHARLATATRWLLTLLDPSTGAVPNLGANDGAYLFPFTSLPFRDYRPVLQAASLAFLGEPVFDPGPWDEMALWLCPSSPTTVPPPPTPRDSPAVLRHPQRDSWAYLRTVRFHGRPGHADLLHLDLWWRGENIARDPGTYLYNAPPPWDNALTVAAVHNTLTVDGRDQMTRSGRFLYLDRAQARLLERQPTRLTAEHEGYRELGVTHRRTVEVTPNGWLVTDSALPCSSRAVPHTLRLHWLLPDWPWRLEGTTLHLRSPHGWLVLTVVSQPASVELQPQLVRAGKCLHGEGPVSATWGWFSPTYGYKLPALAFSVTAVSSLPISLLSEWRFPL